MDRTLEPLDLSNSSSLDNWFERFALYSMTNDKITSCNEVAFLLTLIGKEAYDLVKELSFPTAPKDLKVEEIQKCLTGHLKPMNYEVHERAVFNSLIRKSDQSVRDFIADLQRQAMKCNFGAELNEHLRDRLVAGINNDQIKRKFLTESALTFSSAKDIALAYTSLDSAMKSDSSTSVFYSKIKKEKFPKPKNKFSSNNSRRHREIDSSNSDHKLSCHSCGGNHMRQECKFRNATCFSCKKSGHISKICRSKSKTAVHLVESPNLSEPLFSEDNLCLNLSSSNKKHIKRHYPVSSEDRSQDVEFILDTGSPHSFISKVSVSHFDVPIEKSNELIRGITGHTLPIEGEVTLAIGKHYVRFLVCNELNILGLNEITTLHPELKESLLHGFVEEDESLSVLIEKASNSKGGINIKPIYLEHDDNDPKFFKARPLPYGLRDPVKKTLDRMEADGIVTKIECSRWATPVVTPIKTNGQPRVCGDYRVTINPILRRHAELTPEPEDLFSRMRDATIFSKIDLENAFLQLPLDDQSKELTTINTSFGLYAFNFLPFGTNVSPSIFQGVMNDVIKDLPNVLAYQDDLIVFSRDRKEHQEHVKALLGRLVDFNVRINKTKSVFFTDQIVYLGYLLNRDGLQPDPDKFKPILDAPEPETQEALHSILGSLQYYSRFLPSFADLAAPLFELCRKDAEFRWTNTHSNALQKLKSLIFHKKLKLFNPNAPTSLICDASEKAIGGMLEQDGCPVICVSRKLSESETRYSQTQKEALAIHWCLKRLHKFLFGLKFTIITDHRALVHIFSPTSPVSKTTTNMLQRWALRLSQYDYDIQFQKGSKIPQADFLSRYSLHEDPPKYSSALLINPLPVSPENLIQGTKESFGTVLRSLKNGWSCRARKQFREFYVNRDELSISVEGYLCFRERVVIPPILRKEILVHLHQGHIGIEKMKSIARLTCWWPTLNADIHNFFKSCEKCRQKRKNTRNDEQSWPITYECMQRIHADYAGPLLGKYYLLVVIDSFSKWPEVFITDSANAGFTKRCLRSLFAREGVPQALVTDNGSHFTEADLGKWLKSLNIMHIFTAPRHPKSNGLAENFVKTLKYAISSENDTIRNHHDLEAFIHNFLFQYRNAEHATTRQRPSMLHRGRPLRNPIFGRARVLFRRGNDLRLCDGVILKQLGNKMVSLMDVTDGSIHRRHVEQLEILQHAANEERHGMRSESAAGALRDVIEIQAQQPQLDPSEPPKTLSESIEVVDNERAVDARTVNDAMAGERFAGVSRYGRVRKMPDRMNL